ncbi:MAG: F0F1 ATP synthase subunit epsilon [Chromatiales bacterium]|nr:F0F1 ATP synthase subunit epsilon [Chromatiales bacterium]
MAMTIHVDIVSAEGAIHSGQAEMVYAPGSMGELGIAPRHTPLVTRLKPGEVRVDTGGGEMQHFYVSGGILEVQPHVVTVLADTALRAADLDEAAALEAKRSAEDALQGQQADFEYAKAQAELAEAVAQLRAIEKIRKQTKS